MNAHSEMQRQSARSSRIAGPRLSVLAAAILAACSTGALANPSGATVVGGSASFAQSGSTLTVTNSPGAILHWQSFSIGSGETTHFAQKEAGSAVLNRVVGPLGGVAPLSEILGTLSSNGRVFLINPNGILFGQDARIDVAGLVASTLNLSDQDFLANRLNFTGGGTAGVRNEGEIKTSSGGSVYLVGSSVANTGTISAAGGSVTLAAGQTVRLGDTASPNVLVELDADSERVSNLGTISAAGGEINIYAGVIDQRGVVQANSVGLDPAGRIRFFARHDIGLAAGSATGASGTHGGAVSIDSANGTLLVEGAVSATGATGQGGRIELTGQQVGLVGTAHVDASGGSGGGEILVGGDYHGANADVHNARAIYFGADTQLAADGGTSGDGGRIILWSDEATRAYGKISVRGGAEAGNGGFVETSSAGYLELTVPPDLTANNGRSGEWLLDPLNLTVVATITGNPVPVSVLTQPVTTNSQVLASALNSALDAGGNITLSTSGTIGPEIGDIIIDAAISTTAANSSLTLLAANDVIINQPISSTGNLTLATATALGTGSTRVNASLALGGGVFDATGGNARVEFSSPTPLTVSALAVSTSDIVVGAGADVTLNTDLAASRFLMSGGSVALNGQLQVISGSAGLFSLSSGTIAGSGSILTGGTDFNNALGGGSINLAGTVSLTQTAGNLSISTPITANSLSLTASAGSVTLFGGMTIGTGGFNASAGNVTLFNPGYSVAGPMFVSGNFAMGSNTDLTLGSSFNTISGNVLLDPVSGSSIAIKSDLAGTLRTLAIGGSLNLTDAAADGPGVITLTDMNLTGPSVTGIASTTIAAPIVNLNNSRLNSETFAMSAGALQGSGGQLVVNNSFSHSGGTIDFGLSANSLIKVQHSGSPLNLTQSLRAAEVWLNAADGSLTNAVGANSIAATRVKLESCAFCTLGGVGTAANPVRLSGVEQLLVEVGGTTAGDIYIDHVGAAPLQLGFQGTIQIPAFQGEGAIANNSPGGSVNIKTAGDFALPDYCPDGCFANVRTQGGAVVLTSTGGSIGLGLGGGVIDTTPFPVGNSLPGGDVTLSAAGDIGLFAISTAASTASDGSGANAGNVTITGTNVDVINIIARGANGALPSTSTPANGGNGGNITINASGELVGSGDVSSTSFPFSGGYVVSGGFGGTDQLGDTGFAGGNAGSITLNAGGAGGASQIGRLEAHGGDGGSGAISGGAGGAGGTLIFNAGSSGSLSAAEVWNGISGFEAPALIASGGLGGSGASTGGAGGNAGSISLGSTSGNIEYAWTTNLTGGSAGAGAVAGTGGNGGNLSVSAGGALVIGAALGTVNAVSIDTSGGAGGTVGTVALSGASGITQLDPLLMPNAATKLSLNSAIGSIDLLLANQFANVEGGISGAGNWALRGTQSYTIGNVTVAAGNADFQVDPGASVPNVITFAGALKATTGDVTVRFDEPKFLPTGSITSGTGAANFIAFLPNAGVAPVNIDDVDITDFQRLFTPTFRMGDATTTTSFDFTNTIAAQFLNVGALSIHTTGTVAQTGTGGVQVQGGAGALQVSASSVNLGASSNAFTTLAGTASSTFSVGQNGSIVLGTVDGVTGITAPTQIRLESFGGDVDVTATGLSSASVLYHTPGTGIARLGGTLGGNQTVFHDFVWTGGSLISGAILSTATGVSGSLSGAIALDGTFASDGPLSVSATLSGAGLFANSGALTLTNASFGGVQLVNATAGSVGATGTNSLGTVANAGSFTVAGGSTSGGSLANTGSFNVTGGATTFGAAINDGTLGVANGGTFTATALAANTGSSIVSSGTGGSLAVTGDYQQNGGTLSGTFANLGLTSAGALNFSSGLTASGSLGLSAASTLTLAGSGATYSGGSVGLSASNVVVDSATVSAGSNLGVSAGSLTVVGTSAPAKLIAANNIGISAGNVVVDGGSFGASIDPILLDLTLSGDLTLTGGTGTGAPAELLGDNVNVTANIITLTNGGTGSGATIVASTGNLTMNYASCAGCTVFPAQPTTADIGLFGQTVMLNGILVQGSAGTVSGETSGIEQLIVGTDLAESGAIESQEVAAGGALDDDDDETDDASGDGGSINEQEQKNGVPICS